MIRRWLPFVAGAGILVWIAALVMLALTAEGSQRFGEVYLVILLVNVAGVIALLVLIGSRLADFVRDWRKHVPGSRLRGRTLLMFGGLAIAPLLLVFTFSVIFLTRGIDSWFHAEVRQGLSDALNLSRAALDLRMREYLERTQRLADRLNGVSGGALYFALEAELYRTGADEIIVTSAGGQPVAYSRAGIQHQLPAVPPEDLLLQLRQGRPHVSLQPAQGGGYQVRAATRIGAGYGVQSPRLLIATYPVPQRLSDLAANVQDAYQQYGRLTYLREPLKATFVLTLSLVLLMALLAAVYGALYFSERLVRPVQDLIAGTRAVAKGDLDTRIERPSHDEIGYLVTSFNDMTKKLARAREETERNRAAAEAERAALAVVLARLTSGVISLEPDLRVRVANQAAGTILGVDFAGAEGRPLAEVAAGQPLLAELHEILQKHLAASETEWREQLTLRTDTGRRELVCACTALPGDAGAQGLVLVFDEVTQLLQAQRQAAWGEVARRLAHEIRNPLTPIQLSAERMRRKLMAGLEAREAELLDRSTQTIVQQVEAMKQMVAAFSEYAKVPEMHISEFDLGAMVRQVSDLYHAQDPRVAFGLSLDPRVGSLAADPGRIRQLLNNLLTNSLEALDGRPNPVIMIETQRVGDQVALTVVDNGPGFQGGLLEQAFDPYVTSKPKGTGLGLAIVRRIVEEHGGTVEVDNAPQGGARVRITLPAAAREARRAEARREKA
ncbi:MAG TPA: ATP-binding protein [Steroidobacteraceae bacterium]|nr:ATP-binding protein [Steroidobacteraceae bacterium]